MGFWDALRRFAARLSGERVPGYMVEQLQFLPKALRRAPSLCASPAAFAEVQPGDVVLDIGSGEGAETMLVSLRVCPHGKAIGLDAAPRIVEFARTEAENSGFRNVAFIAGDACQIPLRDSSCDCVISHRTIRYLPDEERIFREAFRILKRGGRLMVSDLVLEDVPPESRQSLHTWTQCIAGSNEYQEYLDKMRVAGFRDVEVVGGADHDMSPVVSVGPCSGPDGSDGDQAKPRLSSGAEDEADSELSFTVVQPSLPAYLVRVSAVKPSETS